MFNYKFKKPVSVLVTGSGRSGTSLMMGCISSNYKFTGEKPVSRNDDSNPKGFFEDADVNFVNDRIIEENGNSLPIKATHKGEYDKGGWINTQRLSKPIISLENIKFIKKLTSSFPFCFKDPRFSYTYPLWKELSNQDLKLLVIYRHPSKTANSMLKEPTPKEIGMKKKQALDVWYAFYKTLLEYYKNDKNITFIHYDQIIRKEIDFLKSYLNIKIDYSFIDTNLNRSKEETVAKKYNDLYKSLNKLSDRSS